MDTTLVTFMIQTPPCTQSLHLIGSWDNFQKRYPMERDLRRGKGHWRGCYTFEDIICDGDVKHPKRTGGLKMGDKYYYYYELNGSLEYHDTSKLFTTSCPYLPGQPVNFLWVPTEVRPLRLRSASMSSIATSDIKTINPSHKALSPSSSTDTSFRFRARTSGSAVITRKKSADPIPFKSDKSLWSLFSLISEKLSSKSINATNSLKPKRMDGPLNKTCSTHDAPWVSANIMDTSTILTSTSPTTNRSSSVSSQMESKCSRSCQPTESKICMNESPRAAGILDVKKSTASTPSKSKIIGPPRSSSTYQERPRYLRDAEDKENDFPISCGSSASTATSLDQRSCFYSLHSNAPSPELNFQNQSSIMHQTQTARRTNSNSTTQPPIIRLDLENLNAFESLRIDMGYLGNLIVV